MPTPSPWIARIWAEFRAGNLTRAYRDVMLTLATFRGAGGLICPSHATLAVRAKCCVKTVQRALAMADQLGLVSWAERRAQSGSKWVRTSNTYRLLAAVGTVQSGQRHRWKWQKPSNGQSDLGEEKLDSLSKKKVLEAMYREAATLPDLLSARRAVIEKRGLTSGSLAFLPSPIWKDAQVLSQG